MLRTKENKTEKSLCLLTARSPTFKGFHLLKFGLHVEKELKFHPEQKKNVSKFSSFFRLSTIMACITK